MPLNYKRAIPIVLLIIVNIGMLYIFYVGILSIRLRNILTINTQIHSAAQDYNESIINYINIDENTLLLQELRESTYIVHYTNLPYAIINISNLMEKYGIEQNRFEVYSRNLIFENVSTTGLIISGTAPHSAIISYINSLHQKQQLVFINHYTITPGEGVSYIILNISVAFWE